MSPHSRQKGYSKDATSTALSSDAWGLFMDHQRNATIGAARAFPTNSGPAQDHPSRGCWGAKPAQADGADPHTCPHPDLRDEAQTCRAVVDPIGVRLEDLPEPLYRVRCGCCGAVTRWWQERRLARAQWVCRWGVAA